MMDLHACSLLVGLSHLPITTNMLQEALLKKVSRERIGIELKKIFQLESERVKDALDQIATLGLHDPIFPRPPYNFSSGILEPQARWSEQQVRLASLCLEQFAGFVFSALNIER